MDAHHHDGRRVEDHRLITGSGTYAADWHLPGQLYGHFVRADHAHAEIVSVHTARALAHRASKPYTPAKTRCARVMCARRMCWPPPARTA